VTGKEKEIRNTIRKIIIILMRGRLPRHERDEQKFGNDERANAEKRARFDLGGAKMIIKYIGIFDY